MLELVFVILIAGILAAALIPRADRDTLYEASEQMLRDIRYTQHLAMMDNVYDDSDQFWYAHRWKIDFSNANQYIVSKSGTNNPATHTIIATDPGTGTAIDGRNVEWFNLADKYNIRFVLRDANNPILFFDHLGRPHASNGAIAARQSATLRDTVYNIDIFDISDAANWSTITVNPETGYAFITYN